MAAYRNWNWTGTITGEPQRFRAHCVHCSMTYAIHELTEGLNSHEQF